MALFPLSATYKLPDVSNANPYGVLKLAAVPIPSVNPGVSAVPANVVTALVEITIFLIK